jgi:hypothetical protein
MEVVCVRAVLEMVVYVLSSGEYKLRECLSKNYGGASGEDFF